MSTRMLALLGVLSLGATQLPAQNVSRIKDMTTFRNVQRTSLVGYGLAVGLDGTGDRSIGQRGTIFTVQSIANLLEQFGVTVSKDQLRTRNAAAVMVTADTPPFGKTGAQFDVVVSSLGDATSLENGVLLMVPLRDAFRTHYAIAQGPISVGGFSISTAGGERLRQNYALVGRVPNGGRLQRDMDDAPLSPNQPMELLLNEPNYTTANRIADAINIAVGVPQQAQPLDASLIQVFFPSDLTQQWQLVEFVARIETLAVEQDVEARVVINERTGTVVAGGNVTIGEILISHGALQIHTLQVPIISQPGAFSPGETVVVPVTLTTAEEQTGEAQVMPSTTNVTELAAALNNLGLKPRDVIAVFQAIKQAGALNARLIIM